MAECLEVFFDEPLPGGARTRPQGFFRSIDLCQKQQKPHLFTIWEWYIYLHLIYIYGTCTV